jgi:Sigma-70 region 2
MDSADVALAAAGDRRAFERLYSAHVNRVFTLCTRICGSRVRGEELTQDVFVRTWEKLPQFRGDSDDVKVENMIMRYFDNKLYSWGFEFELGNYDLLVAALTTKYGVSDSTSELVGPLGRIKTVRSEGKYWTFADGQLAIRRITDLEGGGGSVGAEGTSGSAELDRRKAAAEEADQSTDCSASSPCSTMSPGWKRISFRVSRNSFF